jgi:hypothetical protein
LSSIVLTAIDCILSDESMGLLMVNLSMTSLNIEPSLVSGMSILNSPHSWFSKGVIGARHD